MAEAIISWFMKTMAGLPPELIAFVVSMVPIVELRGGIIASSLMQLPLWKGVLFCMAGNMIPVPFILWFITPIFSWLKKTDLFRPVVERLEEKSLGKSEQIQKYEFWGLLLFAGAEKDIRRYIRSPESLIGAWTGSLIAALLDIKFRKALPAVYLGLVLAVTIMCVVSYFIPWLIASAL